MGCHLTDGQPNPFPCGCWGHRDITGSAAGGQMAPGTGQMAPSQTGSRGAGDLQRWAGPWGLPLLAPGWQQWPEGDSHHRPQAVRALPARWGWRGNGHGLEGVTLVLGGLHRLGEAVPDRGERHRFGGERVRSAQGVVPSAGKVSAIPGGGDTGRGGG